MPQITAFHAAKLPEAVQVDELGKKRKLPGGKARIDLQRDCELFKMLQHACEVSRPGERDSPVECYAVRRLFRKCQDKNGSFMVETTAWEGFDGCPADAATVAENAVGEKPPITKNPSPWHRGYL